MLVCRHYCQLVQDRSVAALSAATQYILHSLDCQQMSTLVLPTRYLLNSLLLLVDDLLVTPLSLFTNTCCVFVSSACMYVLVIGIIRSVWNQLVDAGSFSDLFPWLASGTKV